MENNFDVTVPLGQSQTTSLFKAVATLLVSERIHKILGHIF